MDAYVLYAEDTDLEIYLQFDDTADTIIPFVEGSGEKLRRYSITNQAIVASGLNPGKYNPSARSGDYLNRTINDPILLMYSSDWNGEREVVGKSGGGILTSRIGAASLNPSDFLEVIQGEEKIITFVVEARGRFDQSVADEITVKVSDGLNPTILKEETDGSIERICQELDIQILRCTLSPIDTTSLVEGIMQVEISFDDQKTRLTHALKMIKQVEAEEGS